MNLDYKLEYILNNKYTCEKYKDEYLYIDYNNCKWVRVDSLGNEILNMFVNYISLDRLIDTLSIESGFDKEIIAGEYEDFFNKVIKNDLLVCKDKKVINTISLDNNAPEIWIHLTNECNLACDFCYTSSGKTNIKSLNIGDIKSFLESIPMNNRGNVVISGGEPTLYKDLDILLYEIKELNFKRITLITNGTVGGALYHKLKEYVDSIQISLDGIQELTHEASRGAKTFNKTINNIIKAREVGFKDVGVSMTITKKNVAELPDLPQLAKELKLDFIHITRLMPVGRGEYNINKLQVIESKYEENINKFIENLNYINDEIYLEKETEKLFVEEKAKNNHIRYTLSGNSFYNVIAGVKRVNCGLGSGIISISYDSNIYACPSLHDEEYIIGNIQDSIYEDVKLKGSSISQSLSVDNPNLECYECEFKYFCGGGCRAYARGIDNIYKKDIQCVKYKKNIKEIIMTAMN